MSTKPTVDESSIDEIPLPVSPLIDALVNVSTPSITQFPASEIVITGVWPSSPLTPWIPWAPAAPLVTVNVDVVPFVYVIVYVSTNSSVFVF